MNDSTDPERPGDGFDDPTAPAWASPPPEPWPPTDQPPYPLQPQDTPSGRPPYDADPPGRPSYGQPPYAQQPYGSTAYGQPPYALPPGPYAPPPARNTSSVVLTVVSGIATVLCCLLGLPSLVFGIVALTRQASDPGSAARTTRYGWIVFAVAMAVGVVGVITLGIVGSTDNPTVDDFGGL